MKNKKRVIVVLVTCIILIIAVLVALYVIDAKDASTYAKPAGQLHLVSVESYSNAAAMYEEHRTANTECQTNMLGYDSNYVYSLIFCNVYENIHTPNAIHTQTSESYGLEGRFTYKQNPLIITEAKYVGDDNLNPSQRDIFPKQIADKDWSILSTQGFKWESDSQLLEKAKQSN